MYKYFLRLDDKQKLLIIFVTSVSFFFIYNLKNLNYGLPFFVNADELAHLKSVLYYFGFFSSANQNIVEPIYAPLINFLISGLFIFFYNLLNLGLSVSDLEAYFFLNPDELIYFLRLSSLIVSCFSFFIIYLIFKKLKLNKYIYILFIISIFFSPFILDISLIAGKNSLLLFIFILQFYFFLKFFLKIEKFNFSAYVIFSFLGCIAWGVNYWCASPSIYAIGILHLYKFKLKKLNYLFFFFVSLFLFGILLNVYLSLDNPLIHLFSDKLIENESYYKNTGKLYIFIEDIKNTVNIFNHYEKFLLVLLFISFCFIKNLNNKNKAIYISIFFLSIEPAILFAVADYAYPQLRYFGPSIIFMHLNLSIILNLIISKKLYKSRINILVLFVIFFLIIASVFSKLNIHKNYINLIQKEYLQYKALREIDNIKNKTLIIMPAIYRENLNNLQFYDNLINLNIISLNPEADNKNSFEQRKLKKNKLIKFSEKKMFPNSNKYVFFGGEFLINNYEDFLSYTKTKFDYILLSNAFIELKDILNEKYFLIKRYEGADISVPRDFFNIEFYNKDITQLGYNMSLYRINN